MIAYRWIIAFLALLLAAPHTEAVPQQEAVPMKVTITMAGRTQTLRGTGQCGHQPHAWIYGSPAAMWMASYDGDGGTRVSLTYWSMAAPGAEAQFTLSVQGKSAAHRINTVQGGTLEGSGRATFRPTVTGGLFEIAGKAQDGKALLATIECARFGRIHAEGG